VPRPPWHQPPTAPLINIPQLQQLSEKKIKKEGKCIEITHTQRAPSLKLLAAVAVVLVALRCYCCCCKCYSCTLLLVLYLKYLLLLLLLGVFNEHGQQAAAARKFLLP